MWLLGTWPVRMRGLQCGAPSPVKVSLEDCEKIFDNLGTKKNSQFRSICAESPDGRNKAHSKKKIVEKKRGENGW